MLESNENLAMISNMFSHSHDLSMQLFVEGVDEGYQLVVKELGWVIRQGNFISSPVTADKFIGKFCEILSSHTPIVHAISVNSA